MMDDEEWPPLSEYKRMHDEAMDVTHRLIRLIIVFLIALMIIACVAVFT